MSDHPQQSSSRPGLGCLFVVGNGLCIGWFLIVGAFAGGICYVVTSFTGPETVATYVTGAIAAASPLAASLPWLTSHQGHPLSLSPARPGATKPGYVKGATSFRRQHSEIGATVFSLQPTTFGLRLWTADRPKPAALRHRGIGGLEKSIAFLPKSIVKSITSYVSHTPYS